MKNLIMITTLLLGSLSFADTAEQNQFFLVNALLSHQTQDAVAEYRDVVELNVNVEFENHKDMDVVTLKGIKLLGGDIVCGAAELKITRSWQPAIGFGQQAVYKAETTVKRTCRN